MTSDLLHESPLHAAAARGNLTKVQRLLDDDGADVNACNENGMTPLHRAASNGQEETVRWLVTEAGADVSAKTSDGDTPMHLAAARGFLEIVQFLVEEAKADASARNEAGMTLLHCAGVGGHADIAEWLVTSCKADVGATDNAGRTPLHDAAWSGHRDTAKWLVLYGKADVNARDADGDAPLHHAARDGNLDAVKLLVEQCKADVSAVDTLDNTPVDYAAYRQHHDIVDYLVSKGAMRPIGSSARNLTRLSMLSQVADLVTDVIFVAVMLIELEQATQPTIIVRLIGSFLLAWAVLIGLVPFLRGREAVGELWDGTRLTLISYKLYSLFEGGIEILVLYAVVHGKSFELFNYVFIGFTAVLLALDVLFVVRSLLQERHVKLMVTLLLMALGVIAAAGFSRYFLAPWVPFALLGIAYAMAVAWACILSTADHPDSKFAFLGIKSDQRLFAHPGVRAVYIALSLPLVLPATWWCVFATRLRLRRQQQSASV